MSDPEDTVYQAAEQAARSGRQPDPVILLALSEIAGRTQPEESR